ncbi:MAG: uroporphyrinogen-III C-methyltransferase [Nitrososphaerales archaeon]
MGDGKVILVGAGPGDPGLLTISGLRAIQSCNSVIYDRLVSKEILDLIPAKVKKIYAGKAKSLPSADQDTINSLMLEEVRQGKVVLRLKGGDPFVFGRGGEEKTFLENHDIMVEIIPGLSSALAVPAWVGIPLTHRKYSSSVAIVTGEESRKDRGIDWARIVKAVDTIVILMSVGNLDNISTEMIRAGLSVDAPVAIIQNGTLPNQRIIRSTIGKIGEEVKSRGIEAPSIVIVGNVVSLV